MTSGEIWYNRNAGTQERRNAGTQERRNAGNATLVGRFKWHAFNVLNRRGLFNSWMSDETFIKTRFKLYMGYDLNLDEPKTYCEKLQWLKLYDHNPEYARMADKYEAKNFITEKIGKGHVVPLLGVYNNFDEIDFNKLPDQFVLKCTHDSGGSAICMGKASFNIDAARKKLNGSLSKNYFWNGREWAYKNIKPRIIAEEYIDSLGKPNSIEYKLTCFDGVAKLITICKGIAHAAFDARTNDHYDRDLKPLNFWTYYKNSQPSAPIPAQIHEIIDISEKLSQGVPVLRVDSYIVDGKVYVGEMTFYTWGGLMRFNPPEWDEILGSWINLPPKTQN